jgi:hypothetical protein
MEAGKQVNGNRRLRIWLKGKFITDHSFGMTNRKMRPRVFVNGQKVSFWTNLPSNECTLFNASRLLKPGNNLIKIIYTIAQVLVIVSEVLASPEPSTVSSGTRFPTGSARYFVDRALAII